MRITEHRRERLRRLIRDEYGGVQTALADAIGRQQDYVSRLLSGKKGMGERLARDIEQRLGKPRGWFDEEAPESQQPRGSPENWPFRTFSRVRFNRLTREQKLLVEGAALKVILELEDHRDAEQKSRPARNA